MVYILYGKYKEIRNAAWQLLIDFGIESIPVKISYIAEKAGVILHRNSGMNLLKNNQIGLSFFYNSAWHIVYDNTLSRGAIRFTVAHELGHIFLGHSIDEQHARQFESVPNEEEQSANMFAARLLSPACVLWGIGLTSRKHTKEIERVCDISHPAAKYRAERMEILVKRNMFLKNPVERELYRHFLPFIEKYNSENTHKN